MIRAQPFCRDLTDMIKTPAAILLAGLAMPAPAQTTLSLPAEARVDVQAIDSIVVDRDTPKQVNVLLRPVEQESSSATHRLPDYCLITADARLVDAGMQLSTRTVTCIEAEGDDRTIFSGELSAAAFERDGSLGLDVCTASRDGQCVSALLAPAHVFQLSIGRDTELAALGNPAEQINEQRRRADGE